MPLPTSQFSATLDFLLCLVCLVIAIGSARRHNDFLFSGFLWVAAAALAGTFNLGGATWTHETHTWLSQVARGPGMFALGLGVFAAVYGPLPGSRWLAQALSILGAGMIYLLAKSPRLEIVSTLLGSTLLVALLVLAIQAFRERRRRPAAAAMTAIGLLLVAGFAVARVPLAPDGIIRPVDVLHVLLIGSYMSIWQAVRDMTRPDVD